MNRYLVCILTGEKIGRFWQHTKTLTICIDNPDHNSNLDFINNFFLGSYILNISYFAPEIDEGHSYALAPWVPLYNLTRQEMADLSGDFIVDA